MAESDKKFPVWKPNFSSTIRFEHREQLTRFYSLRSSSSSFIGRKDVREFIFNRNGKVCYLCGSTENIQIDHVVSVYDASIGKIAISELNKESNLKPICMLCNAGKKHL